MELLGQGLRWHDLRVRRSRGAVFTQHGLLGVGRGGDARVGTRECSGCVCVLALALRRGRAARVARAAAAATGDLGFPPEWQVLT